MSAKAPVLFLDFDGVLHPDHAEVDQYFRRVPLFEAVLRDFPADVVISSSWGRVYRLADIREFFSDDIKPRIIDVTPGQLLLSEIPTELWSFVREAQCDAWIREKRPETPWIALDDQAWRFAPASANLLLVDGKTGLTEDDIRKLRLRLEAMVNESGERGTSHE